MLYYSTIKIGTPKIVFIIVILWNSLLLYNVVMPPNDADGMAKSVDP